MGKILFSYISTAGKGGNHMVARTKSELEKHGHKVEMRHSANVGTEQRGNSQTINNQEWMLHWKDQANDSDLVVLFDSNLDTNSKGETYQESEACQAEYRYAQKKSHIAVGKYMDNETSGYVAAKIMDKLNSNHRRKTGFSKLLQSIWSGSASPRTTASPASKYRSPAASTDSLFTDTKKTLFTSEGSQARSSNAPNANFTGSEKYAVSSNPTGPMKKDGTPDMRYAANRATSSSYSSSYSSGGGGSSYAAPSYSGGGGYSSGYSGGYTSSYSGGGGGGGGRFYSGGQFVPGGGRAPKGGGWY